MMTDEKKTLIGEMMLQVMATNYEMYRKVHYSNAEGHNAIAPSIY